MLTDFKNFDHNRLDIDQMVALAAFGKQLRQEYEAHNLEEPEWLDRQLKTLRREITSRNQDRLEKLLREKKLKVEGLKTPAERKTALQKEIKDLEKQLATAG